MNLIDIIRRESVVRRYDFWLETKGVPRRRRREHRSEMRANLNDAAAAEGRIAPALDRLGSPRALAHEASEALGARQRPVWTQGLYAALALFVVGMWVAFLSASVWADAVQAAGVEHEVKGTATLLPGLDFSAHIRPDYIAFEVDGLQWMVLASAVVFLVASRPWRALRS